jgi:hypothetical protein
MTTGRTTTVLTLVLSAMIASTTAVAGEIYYWLDENGVPNYSQKLPDGEVPNVSKLKLADTTPADYDPDEDRYGVQAQAERMDALREEIKLQRKAAREREKNAARQQAVQYRQPVRSYSHGIWYPPVYPRPPHRPQPPLEVPYPTSTLKPPGRSSN